MNRAYTPYSKNEKAHEDGIWCVNWTRSNVIATGSVDETLSVWDPNNISKPLHTFKDYELAVISVTSSHDGNSILSSSMDGSIRLFDIKSSQKKFDIKGGPTDAWVVDFSPDNNIIASGGHSGIITLWDLTSRKSPGKYTGEGNFVLSLAYSPDGKFLASGSYDGVVHVFDTKTQKSLYKYNHHNSKGVRAVRFSADSAYLITGAEDANINVYEVKNGQNIKNSRAHKSWVLSIDIHPTQKLFASSSADKTIKIWDYTLTEQQSLTEHQDQVWSIGFNPSSQINTFASVSDDHSLRLFRSGEN